MKRSVTPPTCALNAIRLPSGDQVGLKISPSDGSLISFTRSPLLPFTMRSAAWPVTTAPNTNWLPSALHAPAELMNCMLSRWGSRVAETSLRIVLPVSASARYMSIENSPASEKYAMRLPSGLKAGAMLYACSRLELMSSLAPGVDTATCRSEEHTSELQSR